MPCGLGRHAIEMAKRGFSVIGLDLSREAIEDARRNGAAAGVEVDWRVADMRDLPWHGELDGAFCLGNSFGYLDPAATRDFLRSLSRSLKAGARFALDYGLAAECILPRLREREWCQVGDIHFLEENRYHAAESCVETTYTFIQNGRTEVKTGLQWVWTVREVRAMLADAGLEVEALFKSPAGEPFEVGAPILLLVARKGLTRRLERSSVSSRRLDRLLSRRRRAKPAPRLEPRAGRCSLPLAHAQAQAGGPRSARTRSALRCLVEARDVRDAELGHRHPVLAAARCLLEDRHAGALGAAQAEPVRLRLVQPAHGAVVGLGLRRSARRSTTAQILPPSVV